MQAQLRTFALNQLNGIVDEFWAEISGSIAKMYFLNTTLGPLAKF